MAHKLVALFVRHGATEANDKNLFRGPIDMDLDEKGKKQAEEVQRHLKNRAIGSAFISSKKRTKQTADIALKGKKIKLKMVKDFDALNVGDLAGEPKTEENMKKMVHYQENPDEKIPGGERLADFKKRVNPKIRMVIKRGEESGKPSVSFVHSSIIHQVGDLLHDDHNAVKVKPGGIVGVFKSPTGYHAKALLKKSEDEQDKHLVS